ncbi:MAG: hypothetical protein INR71_15295, partial [Terriglobus roseus]|nr:hypothetical protein [Terriglobus roseus]
MLPLVVPIFSPAADLKHRVMGQASSRGVAGGGGGGGDAAPSVPPRRRRERLSSLFAPGPVVAGGHDAQGEQEDVYHAPVSPLAQRRRASWMDLSRFREDFSNTALSNTQAAPRFRVNRPRLGHSFHSLSRHLSTRRRTRAETPAEDDSTPSRADMSDPFSLHDPGYRLPDVDVPRLEFDLDNFSEEADAGGRSSSRRSGLRPAPSFSERFSSLRPDRGIRNMTSSLRRRRSPLSRDEDQAAMLSRLLSVAAAATAATLMGGDQRAVS